MFFQNITNVFFNHVYYHFEVSYKLIFLVNVNQTRYNFFVIKQINDYIIKINIL